MANKMMKNNEAISPIVATLVLIVVAIIGAAAVGILLGSFSNNVSNQATEQTDSAITGVDAGSLLCAGSTTCYPVVTDLSALYMKDHPNVKITVQQGGSGAGKTSIGQGLVDIGMSSDAWSSTDASKYPNVVPTLIGGRGVVFVVGGATPGTDVTLDKTDLQDMFIGGHIAATNVSTMNIKSIAVRAESSGTMDTAGKFLGDKTMIYTVNGSKAAYTGNPGVASAVAAGTSSSKVIGVIDFGYYNPATMSLVDIADDAAGITYITNPKNVQGALKDLFAGKAQGTNYEQGLCSGLYVLTNGAPSGNAGKFIDYIKSPAAIPTFTADGVYSIYDLQ